MDSSIDQILQLYLNEKIRENVKTETISSNLFSKNQEKASNYRIKGNEFVKQEQYFKAIEYYNQALCYARPFDVEHANDFALCLANRSQCFLQLAQWSECLQDIRLAKKYKYPEEKQAKLNAREKVCQEFLAKNHVIEEKPLIWVKNDIYMQKSEKWICEQTINAGDTAFTEEPWIKIIEKQQQLSRCSNCFKEIILSSVLFPCKACALNKYCSESCADEDWEQGHFLECDKIHQLQQLMAKEDVHLVLLTLRALIKQKKSIDEFNQWQNLIEYANPLSKQELESLASILIYLLEYENVISKMNQAEFEKTTFIKQFLHTYAKVKSNWIFLHETYLTERAIIRDVPMCKIVSKIHIARAVYLTLSTIPHSCDATLYVNRYIKTRAVLVARKQLFQAQAITCLKYDSDVTTLDCVHRKKLVRTWTGNDCTCTSCERGIESNSQAYVCFECKEGKMTVERLLENKFNIKCDTCSYKVDNKKLTTEQFDSLQAVQDSSKQIKISKLMTYGSKKNYVKAEDQMMKVNVLLRKLVHESHVNMAESAAILGICNLNMRQYLKSVKYAQKAWSTYRNQSLKNSIDHVNRLGDLVNSQIHFVHFMHSRENMKDVSGYDWLEKVTVELKENIEDWMKLIRLHLLESPERDSMLEQCEIFKKKFLN